MKRFVFARWLPALILPVSAWAAEGAPVEQVPPSQPQVQPQAQPVDLEARVGKLEAMVQNSTAFNLLKELEALKAEVARLRGQAEMQQHQLEVLSKRQSDLYIDLDKRVQDLTNQATTAPQAAVTPGPAVAVATSEVAASTPAAVATAAPSGPAMPAAESTASKEDPLAESKTYESALEQFKAGDYEKAIASFGNFLKAYPQSTLAANALYWTGYSYYALKDYKSALAQQMKLVSTYPQSPKVPDALLNIANNQLELNDTASAKKNLEEIVAKYPDTNAATIAAKRLSLIK